jgi:predicted outer membrane protein
MRSRLVMVLIVLAFACNRGQSAARAQDPAAATRAFLLWALQTSQSDADLGTLALRHASVRDTRTLAQQIIRDQSALHADLVRIAHQRGMIVPPVVDERCLALKENLEILSGADFDRAFTLAMAQDSIFMLRGFDRSRSDAALNELASRYRPAVLLQQKASTHVLDTLGGSPFGYSPETGAPPPF